MEEEIRENNQIIVVKLNQEANIVNVFSIYAPQVMQMHKCTKDKKNVFWLNTNEVM